MHLGGGQKTGQRGKRAPIIEAICTAAAVFFYNLKLGGVYSPIFYLKVDHHTESDNLISFFLFAYPKPTHEPRGPRFFGKLGLLFPSWVSGVSPQRGMCQTRQLDQNEANHFEDLVFTQSSWKCHPKEGICHGKLGSLSTTTRDNTPHVLCGKYSSFCSGLRCGKGVFFCLALAQG